MTPDEVAGGDKSALVIGPFGSSLKTSDYENAGVPLVFVRDIRVADFSAPRAFVSPNKAEELRAHIALPGDLLVTKMGDPPGDACIYSGTQPAVITADCIRLRPSRDFDARFVMHALRTPAVRQQVQTITTGAAQQKVSLDRFRHRLSFCAPPLEEQRRIAAILDQADALRAKRRQALALLDELPQATLGTLLDGSHPTVPLGQVAKFIRGVTFKPSDKTSPGDGTVAVMRTKNVQKQLDRSDEIHISQDLVRRREQYLELGDTLISSANSWNLVGKACLVPVVSKPAVVGGFVTALRSTGQVDPLYLFNWFVSPRIQTMARSFSSQTTNIANLNLKRCESLRIPVPPMRRQLDFAQQIHAVTAQRDREVAEQAVQDDLFASLQARAFAGGL